MKALTLDELQAATKTAPIWVSASEIKHLFDPELLNPIMRDEDRIKVTGGRAEMEF
jgi:hypothetical protein